MSNLKFSRHGMQSSCYPYPVQAYESPHEVSKGSVIFTGRGAPENWGGSGHFFRSKGGSKDFSNEKGGSLICSKEKYFVKQF